MTPEDVGLTEKSYHRARLIVAHKIRTGDYLVGAGYVTDQMRPSDAEENAGRVTFVGPFDVCLTGQVAPRAWARTLSLGWWDKVWVSR